VDQRQQTIAASTTQSWRTTVINDVILWPRRGGSADPLWPRPMENRILKHGSCDAICKQI